MLVVDISLYIYSQTSLSEKKTNQHGPCQIDIWGDIFQFQTDPLYNRIWLFKPCACGFPDQTLFSLNFKSHLCDSWLSRVSGPSEETTRIGVTVNQSKCCGWLRNHQLGPIGNCAVLKQTNQQSNYRMVLPQL